MSDSTAELDERERPDETDGADDSAERDDDHLRELEDGSGCTEVWEHLSERRAEADE